MKPSLIGAVAALMLGLSAPAAFAQSYGTPAPVAAGATPGDPEGGTGLANSLRERQHGTAPVYSDDDLTTGSTGLPREAFGENRAAPNRWRGMPRPTADNVEGRRCVVPNFGMTIECVSWYDLTLLKGLKQQ